MDATILASLKGGMWEGWQERVRAALPNFAKSPIYVEQDSQSEEEIREVAEEVKRLGAIDIEGRDRDAAFGGRLVDTCFGPVTRMWLDSNIEYHFLKRHLPFLGGIRLIDIGGGYGRFVATASIMGARCFCTDAVPVSTEVSRKYLKEFAPGVTVFSVDEFAGNCFTIHPDIACNIHSWNECNFQQVENWLAILVEMKVPYLFTVSHGQLEGHPKYKERAYYTCGGGDRPPYKVGRSYRPAIERYYDLVAEESIGLTSHPHALWKLKADAVPLPPMDEKPIVWICTPLRSMDLNGPITEEYFKTLPEHFRGPITEVSNWKDCPFRVQVNLTGGGGVARARNRFASDFMLATSCPDDRLHFVDFDLMPNAQDFVDLWARDLPIVGGLYTTRKADGGWVLNKMHGAVPGRGGLLQVMELGTGFKCFKRSVFEQVLRDNPWLDCESDFDHSRRELGFFSMGPVADKKLWPGRHRWLTEDYWFDWICRESGIPTFVDTRIKLRHKDDFSGKVFPDKFPLDPAALPP